MNVLKFNDVLMDFSKTNSPTLKFPKTSGTVMNYLKELSVQR